MTAKNAKTYREGFSNVLIISTFLALPIWIFLNASAYFFSESGLKIDSSIFSNRYSLISISMFFIFVIWYSFLEYITRIEVSDTEIEGPVGVFKREKIQITEIDIKSVEEILEKLKNPQGTFVSRALPVVIKTSSDKRIIVQSSKLGSSKTSLLMYDILERAGK